MEKKIDCMQSADLNNDPRLLTPWSVALMLREHDMSKGVLSFRKASLISSAWTWC